MGSQVEPNIPNNDSNVKISRMVQDTEVIEHHMVCSSYTGLHEQSLASARSTGRIVVHTPLQNQGGALVRTTKKCNHSDCGDILWRPNCEIADATGRAHKSHV
jgi:hypothetical protein